MASSQVAWYTVLWPLVGFALSNMVQPWGRVGIFKPPLSMYLRCSPIVVIVDSLNAVLRIFLYLIIDLPNARQRFLKTRYHSAKPFSQGSAAWAWRIFNILAYVIGAGGLFQCITLMVLPSILWTKVWICCYIAGFLVALVITFYLERGAKLTEEQRQTVAETHSQPPTQKRQCNILDWIDYISIFIAMLMTCVALTWADPRIEGLNQSTEKKLHFRAIRLSAHVAAYCAHAILSLLHVYGERAYRKWAFSTMALLFLVLLVFLLFFNLRYTQVYFLWSFFITAIAWFLFSFPSVKEKVFFRAPDPSRTQDWTHIIAFDFFLRVTSMSIWWYVKLYEHAQPLSGSSWVDYLG
jgi:hypothetical protein